MFDLGDRVRFKGGGERMTFREFLGDGYFGDLDRLKARGAERVVFWFDN